MNWAHRMPIISEYYKHVADSLSTQILYFSMDMIEELPEYYLVLGFIEAIIECLKISDFSVENYNRTELIEILKKVFLKSNPQNCNLQLSGDLLTNQYTVHLRGINDNKTLMKKNKKLFSYSTCT
jgi:hypothetical protein